MLFVLGFGPAGLMPEVAVGVHPEISARARAIFSFEEMVQPRAGPVGGHLQTDGALPAHVRQNEVALVKDAIAVTFLRLAGLVAEGEPVAAALVGISEGGEQHLPNGDAGVPVHVAQDIAQHLLGYFVEIQGLEEILHPGDLVFLVQDDPQHQGAFSTISQVFLQHHGIQRVQGNGVGPYGVDAEVAFVVGDDIDPRAGQFVGMNGTHELPQVFLELRVLCFGPEDRLAGSRLLAAFIELTVHVGDKPFLILFGSADGSGSSGGGLLFLEHLAKSLLHDSSPF